MERDDHAGHGRVLVAEEVGKPLHEELLLDVVLREVGHQADSGAKDLTLPLGGQSEGDRCGGIRSRDSRGEGESE